MGLCWTTYELRTYFDRISINIKLIKFFYFGELKASQWEVIWSLGNLKESEKKFNKLKKKNF